MYINTKQRQNANFKVQAEQNINKKRFFRFRTSNIKSKRRFFRRKSAKIAENWQKLPKVAITTLTQGRIIKLLSNSSLKRTKIGDKNRRQKSATKIGVAC
jgi:hypothetical protein